MDNEFKTNVKVKNFGNVSTEIVLNVESIEKPKLEFKETKIETSVSIAYIAGKHEWVPIKMVIKNLEPYDKLVGFQIQRQLDSYNNSKITTCDLCKQKIPNPKNYMFNMLISITDDNKFIERIEMIDCFIQDVSYEEETKIELIIRYNNAIIKTTEFNEWE